MNKIVLICIMSFLSLVTKAQEAPQMADALRENGKIYVVIAVIGIVFLCLVVFLVYLERKLKKLEEKINSKS
jgi:hypothetical protein